MKSIKKLLAILLAMFMLLMGCLLVACNDDEEGPPTESEKHNAFIQEIGGVSETYKGETSQSSYATANEAASAFVQEQIVGQESVSILNATPKGTLSESEVSSLKLSNEDSEGLVSVEKIEVEYAGAPTSAKVGGQRIRAAGQLTNNKKVVVYIIKYENHFKYFTPCPVTGETINKSYYDSVFSSDRYANCTYEYTMTLDMNINASGQGQSMTLNMVTVVNQKILYSADAIYIETSAEVKGMSSVGVPDTKETQYFYIEKVTNSDSIQYLCYYSEDNMEWSQAVSLVQIGFSDLSELSPFADQYLDYTYFTKTDFGFEIANENADRYVSEIFEELGSYSQLGAMDIDIIAKYYVSQGALFGMRLDMNMDMNYSESGMSMMLKAIGLGEARISNCGTTVVEKPFAE